MSKRPPYPEISTTCYCTYVCRGKKKKKGKGRSARESGGEHKCKKSWSYRPKRFGERRKKYVIA
jgi:hypothetical protein